MKDVDSSYNDYNIVITAFDLHKNYLKNRFKKHGAKVIYQKEALPQVNPQLLEWLGIFNESASGKSISYKAEEHKGKMSAKSMEKAEERRAEAGRNTVETESEARYNEESKNAKYSRKGDDLNERAKGVEISDRRRNENPVSSLERNTGHSVQPRRTGSESPGGNANQAGIGGLSDYTRKK